MTVKDFSIKMTDKTKKKLRKCSSSVKYDYDITERKVMVGGRGERGGGGEK